MGKRSNAFSKAESMETFCSIGSVIGAIKMSNAFSKAESMETCDPVSRDREKQGRVQRFL